MIFCRCKNGPYKVPGGKKFHASCHASLGNPDGFIGAPTVSTFHGCMAQCSRTAGCGAVTYSQSLQQCGLWKQPGSMPDSGSTDDDMMAIVNNWWGCALEDVLGDRRESQRECFPIGSSIWCCVWIIWRSIIGILIIQNHWRFRNQTIKFNNDGIRLGSRMAIHWAIRWWFAVTLDWIFLKWPCERPH